MHHLKNKVKQVYTTFKTPVQPKNLAKCVHSIILSHLFLTKQIRYLIYNTIFDSWDNSVRENTQLLPFSRLKNGNTFCYRGQLSDSLQTN